jgi:uncharacterized protein (TIGR00106 family)
MSVLVEFSMFPTDKGNSVSAYVSRIIDGIDRSGVAYQLTPMGTVFETETMDEALAVIKNSYAELEKDCHRVYTNIKMDIRQGTSLRMTKKIESIENKLGRRINK